MVARILEFKVTHEKKNEFIKAVEYEIMPMLRQQSGFVEMLSFFPERAKDDRAFTISLWTMKADAEYYEREVHPRMYDILKSYLPIRAVMRPYTVETGMFEYFAEALAA